MPYVILKQPFDLELSLSMGQAFRWRCWKPTNVDAREDDSSSGCWWSGVIGPYLVHLRDTEAEVEYRVVGPHGERKGLDMAGRLRHYFRDDDPIQDVYDSLKGDVTVGSLLREYPGMRVIRQDPWECLVTYVLTQGTLIERTKAIVEVMAERWGQPLELGSDVRYTFPSAETLLQVGPIALSNLTPRFRFPERQSATIIEIAERVTAGDLDWCELAERSYSYATDRLMTTKGVGYKVANCVALMALEKPEAFPVDVWVNRAMNLWYQGDYPTPSRPDYPSQRDHDAVIKWATSRFGPYAGYAGQYLFHGIEPNKGGAKGDAGAAHASSSTALRWTSEETNSLHGSRYENRNHPCPKCGARTRAVCRSPSGYRYEKGHSVRVPRG